MEKAVIIGGGFSGLAAAGYLQSHTNDLQVLLIDRMKANHFRPLLPDMIDHRLSRSSVCYPLNSARQLRRCQVRHETALNVNLDRQTVKTETADISYDYLILACGMVTNFHNVESARKNAFRFRNASHAIAVRDAIMDREEDTLVVVGGGYTGVEVISHAWRQDTLRCRSRRRIIVEATDQVCHGMPEAFQEYVANELRELGVEIQLETTVREAGPESLTLSNGERIEPAVLVWTAGVRAPEPVASMEVPRTQNGRLEVDPCLRISDRCFAAGDIAGFKKDGAPLRMGIQFALSEGRLAARNIIRLMEHKEPQAFSPFDPGYIIPMGHGRACGFALGRPIWGRSAMALHYVMCLFRTYGLRRSWRVLRELCKDL